MTNLIEIGGAVGEGGGQILRTSLSLSMATGRAFRMFNVRAKRSRGGLLRQHLTALRAAAEACGAQLKGDALGSREIEFIPGRVRHGEYRFAIGTAGSTSLVLQTVLMGLLRTRGESRITVEGGTENRQAPPSDFLIQSFAPLVRRLGVPLHIEVERRGYYPAGGGRLVATLSCQQSLSGFSLMERGDFVERRATARVSALPVNVAHRELVVLRDMLDLKRDELVAEEEVAPFGPGNIVSVVWRHEHVTEVFSGFGERGRPAESVAMQAATEASRWEMANVAAGEHLADQLVLLLALAGHGSFTTVAPSLHARTQFELIPRFLPVTIRADGSDDRWEVHVASTST
jgi:RNA 3'-terminal phosphate cyclase (ATP)